jgi:hypothetical protein
MAEDSPSRTRLYIALGALVAVGAGLLAWRLVLAQERKGEAKVSVSRTGPRMRGGAMQPSPARWVEAS